MFEKILEILYELDDLPFIIVHKVIEHHIEDNDDIRYIKIKIYKLYGDDFYNLIYKANCKENNPESYLIQISNQLIAMKNKYLKYLEVGDRND